MKDMKGLKIKGFATEENEEKRVKREKLKDIYLTTDLWIKIGEYFLMSC